MNCTENILKKLRESREIQGFYVIDNTSDESEKYRVDTMRDARKKIEELVQSGSDLQKIQISPINPQDESVKIGSTFKNAGYKWEVLDTRGDYTLVYTKDKKITPYVVAWKLDTSDWSWAAGHYFDDEESAQNYLDSKDIDESTDSDYYEPTPEEAKKVVSYIKRRYGNTVKEQDYIDTISRLIAHDNVGTDIIDYHMERSGIKITESTINEDWRSGTMSDEEMDKYLQDQDEKSQAISWSLMKMREKHPQYEEKFNSTIKGIRDRFDTLL